MSEVNVELYLNGKIFSGWRDVSIFRSLESMSGQFTLGIAVRHEDDISVLTAGASVQVKMQGQTVITGYLDEVTQRISGDSKAITVLGRDKTADLIDCSVIHTSYQFKQQTLKQIADALCKPFGISVVWQATDADANEIMPVWQVEPGETVFDTLAKLAKHKGILVTSNAEGNLVFTDPGSKKVGTFELGVNLLELEVKDDWSQRYSIYRVIGDAEQGGEKGDTEKNKKKRGESKKKASGKKGKGDVEEFGGFIQ